MKVLWLCNICLPVIAQKNNWPAGNKEGWLSGLSNRCMAANEDIELGLAFPAPSEWTENKAKVEVCFQSGDKKRECIVTCYGFNENTRQPEVYDHGLDARMEEIVSDFQPEVVHVFGTEYSHTLAMAKAMKGSSRLLIGIQGMCTTCAKVYTQGIPEKIIKRSTLRDLLRKDNILQQQQVFEKRGQHERSALALTANVTGRTTCDREFCETYAPKATYYSLNETLRDCFYEGTWNYENCVKYRIFVSQADYPIKGFHYLLQALPIVRKKYPQMTVCVTGNCITGAGSLKKKLKISSYGKYLNELTTKNGLQDCITYLGSLTAAEMKEQYLQANVFVLCSLTENSPNCVGEAMLLQTPVVAAAVGGVPSLIYEKQGYLYHEPSAEALADAILTAFDENGKEEMLRRCEAAGNQARITHHRVQNDERLLEIYREIAKKE